MHTQGPFVLRSWGKGRERRKRKVSDGALSHSCVSMCCADCCVCLRMCEPHDSHDAHLWVLIACMPSNLLVSVLAKA